MEQFFVLLEVRNILCIDNIFQIEVRSFKNVLWLEVHIWSSTPVFWIQVLQNFFGYEPYPGFQKDVQARVQADIKEWTVKKQEKLA